MGKQYKFIKQSANNDCAVACLMMIFNFYKLKVKRQQLIKSTKLDNIGLSAYQIVKLAKKYGFKCVGYQMQKDYFKPTNKPFIMHVITDEKLQHYVVVFQIKKDKVLLADPAEGLKWISVNDALVRWSGIVLTFTKNHAVKEKAKKTNIIINILKCLQNKITNFLFISIIWVALNIISSLFLPIIVNALIKGKLKDVFFIIILFAFINFIKNIITYIRNNLFFKLNNEFLSLFIAKVIRHLLFLPHIIYQRYSIGEISSRINDVSYINVFISKVLMTASVDMLLLISTFLVLLLISYKAAMLAVITFIIYMLIYYKFKTRLSKKTLNTQKSSESFLNIFVDSIKNVFSIKNLLLEKKFVKKIMIKHNEFLENGLKLNKYYNKNIFFKSNLIDLSSIFIIIIYIVSQSNSYNIGNLLIVISIFSLYINSLNNIVDMQFDFEAARTSFNRINELLIYNEEQYVERKYLKFNNLILDNVCYSYDGIVKSIKNVSFSINNTDKVLINGDSGSGKTTIFKMIAKQLGSNNIYINNKLVKNIENQVVRNYVLYVNQSEELFSSNVVDNLSIITNNYKTALKHVFLEKNSFEILEKNINEISGGEKQRLLIARALISDTPVIIFDETTNQIDVELERKILININKYYNYKTIILITHRKSNEDLFNTIIKIDKGQIKSIKKGNLYEIKQL